MTRWIRFLWVFGLVVLVFGIIGGFVVDFSHPLMAAHIVLGFITLVVGVISSFRSMSADSKASAGRQTASGLNAIIYTAIVLALLGCLNWVSARNNKRLDFTEEKVFSLADQSTKAVADLDKPLNMVFFASDPGSTEKAKSLLKLYKDASPNVSGDVINPATKPHLVEKYKMTQGNLVYIGYGKEDELSGDVRLNEVTEESLTNGIIKLTRGAAKKVYFVVGHDELSTENQGPDGVSSFAQALKDEHLVVEDLLLAEKGTVPSDAAMVLLLAPKKDLMQAENDALLKYVNDGGSLLVASDPRINYIVNGLTQNFGITISDDLILDLVQRLFAGPELGAQPIVRDYSYHPITAGFSNRTITIFNLAASLRLPDKDKQPTGAVYTELAKTGASAWGESNLAAVFDNAQPQADKGEGDRSGPVPIAVSYEKAVSGDVKEGEAAKKGKVVVVGDSDWLANSSIGLYANRDMAVNVANWLSGSEAAISIRPKSFKFSMAPIPESTFILLLALSFLIPELVLIFGLVVWWRRKTAYGV